MMAPPPDFSIVGTACRDVRKVPFKFTSITRSHICSISAVPDKAFLALTPALLTTMWRPPYSPETLSMTFRTEVLSVTSQV